MHDTEWPRSDMFIVYYTGGKLLEAANISHMARKLDDRLFLVLSPETQSRLYHHVKRLASPDALFVGRLAALPKFKGMQAGTTKWVGSHMPT
ncbi:MAG: hypothetical protein CME99_04300 [Hyphomonas sp.]|uniref:Uncharacterized protein n=1 Tax=Hyphomonas atlantica TaxID=1280948 RepID=A0A353L3B2_9PROT|nr:MULTISPECIES: hypothetical protein [Hyphomonas]MAH92379.1 hypothetical protein [Hyphomonas sp.]HBF90497.1 hypothetical protein [Hyphomonas atlantica]HBQ47987.1 hypothetical protein [Hyphomonas atlantica]